MPTISITPPTLPKQKTKHISAAQAKKAPNVRRRPLDEDTQVYGDALFEEAILPVKIAYVTFHDLLENNVRKSAVEYFPFHHQQIIESELEEGEKPIMVWIETFNLYYFKHPSTPLLSYI